MSEEKKTLKRIRYMYEKARHHRTFHADGAWGGLTPQGEVQFAFFNDLRPMPDSVTHAVTADGQLGEEISREHKIENIVREANVTVVMNRETTKKLIELLGTLVTKVEEADAKSTVEEENQDA